jgi:hypothetical protein
MIDLEDRQSLSEDIGVAHAAGAQLHLACEVAGISRPPRTPRTQEKGKDRQSEGTAQAQRHLGVGAHASFFFRKPRRFAC